MVVVALLDANAATVPATTITSTFRRTKSAASSGNRWPFCSANRYSKAILFPSIHPSLLSSCRNASKRTALPEAVPSSRKPMRKIFPVCCASATAPHNTNATMRAKSPAHFGFWTRGELSRTIADPSAKLRTGFGLSDRTPKLRTAVLSFTTFSTSLLFQLHNPKFLPPSTREGQDRGDVLHRVRRSPLL